MVLDEENVDGKGHDEAAQGKMEILDDVFFHGGHLLCLIGSGHRKGGPHLKPVLIPSIWFCFFRCLSYSIMFLCTLTDGHFE